MARFYYYNDLRGFENSLHNVRSNLCCKYFTDKKKRFCGNYVSRKVDKFNKRCWRHPSIDTVQRPKVLLLMVSASERFYNRERWVKFLATAQDQNVPIELVIYHEDMWNCTVRNPQNLLSRFRPIPTIFGTNTLPLRKAHGGINFAQIHLKLLDYGTKTPNASRCIVITERTIPIKSPKKVYASFMSSKCYIDISYNTSYNPKSIPKGLPSGLRGKPFTAVNGHAQGLYTVEFLREALPTVGRYFAKFGLTRNNTGVYTVSDPRLLEQWREFTGANTSEFWLLNSFLIQKHVDRTPFPISELKKYMDKTKENDYYPVAEIPQTRDGWKRTFIFRHERKIELIKYYDRRTKNYYKGLEMEKSGVSLRRVIRFLRKNKKRAMFFRQVELP